MRHSKGFILAEILISMMLQAGFVIVLCGAFYLLVSFESDVQMKLVARARGQRVIQYIDQRIRNAGIGLQGGSYKNGKIYYNNSRCVRVTLDPFTREQTPKGKLFQNSGSSPSKYLRLPVALTYKGNDFKASDTSGSLGDTTLYGDATFVGNVLTLFYAQRETDTANFVIVPI
ncbi:MAG: hypothetical protein IJP96_09925, partial [Synergistaceae bacterium]|nr:hypothetical protein [Synergistaceae bacterium]